MKKVIQLLFVLCITTNVFTQTMETLVKELPPHFSVQCGEIRKI